MCNQIVKNHLVSYLIAVMMLKSDSNSRLNISLPPISKIFIEVYYVKCIFHANILDSHL